MTFAKDHFPVIGVNESLHESCVMWEALDGQTFSVSLASRRVDMDFVVSASGVHNLPDVHVFVSFFSCEPVPWPLCEKGWHASTIRVQRHRMLSSRKR